MSSSGQKHELTSDVVHMQAGDATEAEHLLCVGDSEGVRS
jgi:hypothetical protein